MAADLSAPGLSAEAIALPRAAVSRRSVGGVGGAVPNLAGPSVPAPAQLGPAQDFVGVEDPQGLLPKLREYIESLGGELEPGWTVEHKMRAGGSSAGATYQLVLATLLMPASNSRVRASRRGQRASGREWPPSLKLTTQHNTCRSPGLVLLQPRGQALPQPHRDCSAPGPADQGRRAEGTHPGVQVRRRPHAFLSARLCAGITLSAAVPAHKCAPRMHNGCLGMAGDCCIGRVLAGRRRWLPPRSARHCLG